MHLSTRDLLATVLVGVALVLYAAWLFGMDMPWFTDSSAVAVGVLVLGTGASLSAVVPAFAELLHGSRPYLVGASSFGLVAFVGGLWAVFANEPIGLAVLVAATLVLWAMSTWRHMQSADARVA
jgi:hypothetical protein